MKSSRALDVLGFGFGHSNDLAKISANADFRKATLKMQLACLSIEAAVESLKQSKSEQVFENRDEIGFICNSGFGELEATVGFLRGLSELGVARPLLFQNSLHNSTTGFCAIRFGLTGAAITLNHRVFGGEQALQTAQTLIQDGECRIGLVTTVETVPAEFSKFNESGIEGATSLIVADSEWSREQGFLPYVRIADADCAHAPVSREQVSAFASNYEFDAIRKIAIEISAQITGEKSL